MSRRRVEPAGRAVRWLLSGAALALAPKCLLCAAAYLGFGAALGLTGPELCGAAPAAPTGWLLPALAWGGLVMGIFAWRIRPRRPGAVSAPARHLTKA